MKPILVRNVFCRVLFDAVSVTCLAELPWCSIAWLLIRFVLFSRLRRAQAKMSERICALKLYGKSITQNEVTVTHGTGKSREKHSKWLTAGWNETTLSGHRHGHHVEHRNRVRRLGTLRTSRRTQTETERQPHRHAYGQTGKLTKPITHSSKMPFHWLLLRLG